MEAKNLLLLAGVACLLAAQVVSGTTCACQLGGEGGSNPCGCSELIVRPPPRQRPTMAGPRLVVHRVSGPQAFTPVGDVCTCDRSYVSPAAAPARPPCAACAAKRQGGSLLPQLLSGTGPRTLADETPLGCQHQQLGYGLTQSDAAAPRPADAVSVSLAYGQAQQAQRAVREEAIAFGPRALPRDGFIRKQPKNVPEEGLLSFDAPVVELRARPAKPCSAALLEEEARDALLRAEQEALEAALEESSVPAAAISYSDLGYLPEAERHQHFVREAGCVGIESDSVIPPGSPRYTLPLPVPQAGGRVIVSNYENTEEEQEEQYGDDDGGASVETGALPGAFVPVDAAYPRPTPCDGSVLVERLAQAISGCGSDKY